MLEQTTVATPEGLSEKGWVAMVVGDADKGLLGGLDPAEILHEADQLFRERTQLRGTHGQPEPAHARCLWRLAACLDSGAATDKVVAAIQQAHALDPGNPYILTDMLAVNRSQGEDWLSQEKIAEARAVCVDHVANGLDMPAAALTAGRLSLLLGEDEDALAWYGVGLSSARQSPGHLEYRLRWERTWLRHAIGEEHWVGRLLNLAGQEWEGLWLHEDVKPLAGEDDPTTSALAISEALDEWRTAASRGRRIESAAEKGMTGRAFFHAGEEHSLHAQIALSLGMLVLAQGQGEEAKWAPDIVRGTDQWAETPIDSRVGEAIRALTEPVPELPMELEVVARAFHQQWYEGQERRALRALWSSGHATVKPSFKPWEELSETSREANLAQVRGMVWVLRMVGLDCTADTGGELTEVTEEQFEAQVDLMAQYEHGRWVVEHLLTGWRYSPERDDEQKLHDNIVGWQALDEATQDNDRGPVREWRRLLMNTDPPHRVVRHTKSGAGDAGVQGVPDEMSPEGAVDR